MRITRSWNKVLTPRYLSISNVISAYLFAKIVRRLVPFQSCTFEKILGCPRDYSIEAVLILAMCHNFVFSSQSAVTNYRSHL